MASDSLPPAQSPSLPSPLPPPLPPPAPVALGIRNGGQIIPGTEGMSPSEVAQAVLEGGRFVHFLYCVSIVVMTFRRSTELVFLRPGQDGAGTAIGPTVVTGLLGWWGFPWGPIYSIQSLYTNLTGGSDLTREVVSTFLPPEAVQPLMAQRVKPKASGLFWAFRVAIIAMPILLVIGIYSLGAVAERAEGGHTASAAFDGADRWVAGRVSSNAGGNTPEARKIGQQFATTFKAALLAASTQGTKAATTVQMEAFPTWCELHDHECILLVQVPDLRRYKREDKGSICDLAWTLANLALPPEANAGPGKTKLVVGVRGAVLYEKVMIGPLQALSTAKNRTYAGPTETLANSEGRRRLERLFAVSHQAAPAAPAATAAPKQEP